MYAHTRYIVGHSLRTSSVGIVKWEDTPEGSTLTIERLQETNRGKYTCEAEKDTADAKVTSKASVTIVVLPRECGIFCRPAGGRSLGIL